MNVEMLPIEIIGLKKNLQLAIQTIRELGCMHIDEITESMGISARPLTLDRETLSHQEELSYLVARIEGLLDALSVQEVESVRPKKEDCLAEARNGVETLSPTVQSLADQREKLQTEIASLPRYEATLRKLLPISPPSAHEVGKVTIGILVSRAHVGILDSIGRRVLDLTAGRAEIVASDVDTSTRAMLLVFPEEFTNDVESLLGQEDVSRLRLPSELGEGPPDVVLAVLHRRMVDIPIEIQNIDRELSRLASLWGAKLIAWRDNLRDQIEANSVLPLFGETDMTFVLAGWIPKKDLDRLRESLTEMLDGKVLVRQLSITPEIKKLTPVALQNPGPAKPFESLVNLLALPRYGHIDPTRLMALFFPLFYGMILGDVGYGLLLLVLGFVLLRKLKRGVARDVVIVLIMGAAWSILFGILYGEAFGTLGEHLGMHALWFDRASADHVAALLIMTLVVGAVHITLGLILGVWEAFKDRSRNHLLERGGMLLALISLFLLVGVLAEILPAELKTPAWVGMIIGVVLLGASLGWLGVIMGPIEFIGLIGNVLSYLRIAAIGLASVYLAKVANDVAGLVGNIFVGIIIALLIHALNLVLGAFSPTIHSLRLHYVEFFRKFYEGGGRPYKPFRSSFNIGLDYSYDSEEG